LDFTTHDGAQLQAPEGDAICDQKFNFSMFHWGKIRIGVAEPNRIHTIAPSTISNAPPM